MRLKRTIVGVAVAGAVLTVNAMTLGRIRGAAWIGQPLQLSLPVQAGAEDINGLCAQADVFYGDTRLAANLVQVVQEPGSQGDSVNLKISTSSAVDEPMVTVYLRAGCKQSSTRKYVLLADYPTLGEAPATPLFNATGLPIAAQPSLAAVTPPLLTEISQNDAQPVQRPPQSSRPVQSTKTPRQRTAPESSPAKAGAVKAATPAPTKAADPLSATRQTTALPVAKPRLKLDPLENLAERIKTLETTTSAVPLEDLVRDGERMRQMQDDMKALLQQAAKNEASLAVMRERLERAESERVPAAVVYGLGALVLICFGAIALLWNRRSAQRSGWSPAQNLTPQGSQPLPTGNVRQRGEEEDGDDEHFIRSTQQVETRARPTPHESSASVDVNLMEINEEDFGRLLKPEPTKPAELAEIDLPLAFDSSPPATPSSVPPPLAVQNHHFYDESIFDLQQQAEFFDRLGKTNEALELLEARISKDPKSCPTLYLEALAIAHRHNLKTDFREFREKMQGVFNCNVPEFALFQSRGKRLDGYASLLDHITQVWSTRQVVTVIEACILRDAWEKNADPFDMPAFEELVVLHGIALDRHRPADGGPETTPATHPMHVDLSL